MQEKLSPEDGIASYISDFKKSDAPQFQGKSPEKRRDMAIAAYLDAKRGERNEACWDGYTKKGMKKKGDRMVPNCVRKENESYGEPSKDARKRAGTAQQRNVDKAYVKRVKSNSSVGIRTNVNESVSNSIRRFRSITK